MGWRFPNYSHGQKSWDTFAFLGRFPIHNGPTPPLSPQIMLDACIENFFRVSTLYRVGGERTTRKFRKGCTVLRGNREMTEKHEYCSSVPRTFVQDCRSVKGVPFVNIRYTKGVPCLSKMVYKRLRFWTLEQRFPVQNFLEYSQGLAHLFFHHCVNWSSFSCNVL